MHIHCDFQNSNYDLFYTPCNLNVVVLCICLVSKEFAFKVIMGYSTKVFLVNRDKVIPFPYKKFIRLWNGEGEDILTDKIPVIGLGKSVELYIYSNGREWTTTLENDLQGNIYFFSFYLASSVTSQVDAEIILNSGPSEVVLASTSFIVSSKTYSLFEDTVTGIDPDIPSGGHIALRLKSTKTVGLLSADGRIPYIDVIPSSAPYIFISSTRFGLVQIVSFLSSLSVNLVLGSMVMSSIYCSTMMVTFPMTH